MDSDLAEALSALKEAFAQNRQPLNLGSASADTVTQLKNALRIPRRYRDFLTNANPKTCEVHTPSESLQLLSAEELLAEQEGFALEGGELISRPRDNGWRRSWIIIGHSTLLGDPYLLDISDVDAEGDCPVFSAMSGTSVWQPKLCAQSFANFLKILALNVELASEFKGDDYEDESVFREALAPKLRQIDPAALKAGHWT